MTNRGWIVSATVLLISYLGVVISSALGWNPLGLQWDFSNPGGFGDSFGPLNTLMAGLAAAGAIGAYLSQKKELKDSQSAAAKERSRAEKRDFENTFFNLLVLLRDTTKEIEVPDSYMQNPVRGRDAITRIVDSKLSKMTGDEEACRAEYARVYNTYSDDLGHYFRLMYQIVRLINESSVEDKMVYIRVLRATLSGSEIVLLGLNCKYGEGNRKFKPLVEKYALLHNISESSANRFRLIGDFEDSAFGDRPEMLKRASKTIEDVEG